MKMLTKAFAKTLHVIVFMGFSSAFAGAYDDFLSAIRLDNAYAVTKLLQKGFDPNAVSLAGQYGLLQALKEDSFATAEALLASPQINVNVLNGQDESPLMLAALKGQLSLCKQLLKQGAQVNLTGWSPLHYAASGPSLEVAELLINAGAALNATSPNKTTPLMMAAGYGGISIAQLLQSRGADLNLRNEQGLSAADFALKAGRDTLAQQLKPSAAAVR